jgi:transposase-like protein
MNGTLLTLSLGALCALSGCASPAPRPTEAMTRAESSVQQADQAGARRYDPGTLDASKDKLAQSKAAAERGDKRVAQELAEQAELDAELAAANARSENAQKAAAEVRASIETLRAEMARQAAR